MNPTSQAPASDVENAHTRAHQIFANQCKDCIEEEKETID